jgi:hypothetical protein
MKKVFTQMLIGKISAGFLPMLGGMNLFLYAHFAVSGNARDESGQPVTGAGMWYSHLLMTLLPMGMENILLA